MGHTPFPQPRRGFLGRILPKIFSNVLLVVNNASHDLILSPDTFGKTGLLNDFSSVVMSFSPNTMVARQRSS